VHGAHVSCGANYREPLHAYGMAFGSRSNCIDDVLDITQRQDALGKPSCGDIVEGKKTLPILFMREGLGQRTASGSTR